MRWFPPAIAAVLLLQRIVLSAAGITVAAPDTPMLRFALGQLESALKPRGDVLKRIPFPPSVAAPDLRVDIDPFISHPVLDTKRYVNIADFVKAGGAVEPGKFSPAGLADELDRDCARALKLVAAVRGRARSSAALECELTDIEAGGAYGNYLAEKLRGGLALAQARVSQDGRKQEQAVAALEKALGHWKRLAELGARFNRLPIPSSAKEPFAWGALTPAVERDVEVARAPLSPRSSPSSKAR